MGHRCCAAFSNRQEADELEQELDSLSDTQQALVSGVGLFCVENLSQQTGLFRHDSKI